MIGKTTVTLCLKLDGFAFRTNFNRVYHFDLANYKYEEGKGWGVTPRNEHVIHDWAAVQEEAESLLKDHKFMIQVQEKIEELKRQGEPKENYLELSSHSSYPKMFEASGSEAFDSQSSGKILLMNSENRHGISQNPSPLVVAAVASSISVLVLVCWLLYSKILKKSGSSLQKTTTQGDQSIDAFEGQEHLLEVGGVEEE